MNDSELIRRVDRIKVWQQHGKRAPHKPLLLLYALGRVQSKSERLVAYPEVERVLHNLLEQFGPSRKNHHPDQPFKRLPRDNLWVLQGPDELASRPPDSLRSAELKKHGVAGGFPQEIYDLLKSRPDLVETIASNLLYSHFPKSYHEDIRRTVGLQTEEIGRDLERNTVSAQRNVRDPRFRENVLRAYGRECCVCGFNLRLENALFDLEAAHIKWHSEGGPDQIENGLALCGFHHKAFDYGAWGLQGSDYSIQVSTELNGSSPAIDLLLNFEGEGLRLPRVSSNYPNPEYVEWHRREVFRDASP